AWSPCEHASEQVGLPIAFCRSSEGISEVLSLSVAVCHPASLTGKNFLFWLCVGFGSEYGLVILAT
ncbi:hypothetical protein A2U01_0082716, partial [Trifolium medium]|nr:hypothetical protein [Trifolium medium]